MSDIEKVKQGLRCCFADNCLSKACPYGMENDNDCLERLAFDALSVIESIQAEIERLKDQVPKKGKWVKKHSDLLYCSNCDAPSKRVKPFCYMCGADMREVEGNGTD